jgi:hypothetical protein
MVTRRWAAELSPMPWWLSFHAGPACWAPLINDKIFPKIWPDQRVRVHRFASSVVCIAACRVAKPLPHLPGVERAVRGRPTVFIGPVVLYSGTDVYPCRVSLVELIVISPVCIESDIHRASVIQNRMRDALQGEPCLQFLHRWNARAAGRVGVRSVDREEVGKTRQHGAQLGASTVFFPQLLDSFALDASDLHRPQKVVRLESGSQDYDVYVVFSTVAIYEPSGVIRAIPSVTSVVSSCSSTS